MITSINGEKIVQRVPLGGGSIANSMKVRTYNGNVFFVKKYSNPDVSLKEKNGLNEIAKSYTIKVPEVIMEDDGYLILELVKKTRPNEEFFKDFGRALASMHKHYGKHFGFYEDNYIGSNIQQNTESESWTEFYFENRLLYQFKLAEKQGYADDQLRELFSMIESKIEKILECEDEKPSLLHGDLWSGNYLVGENNEPILIDPAVYYGHREADLAMTKLFGSFDKRFYDAYNEYFPLGEGYEYRENIYKLYHVLNHLNLFGNVYYGKSVSIMKSYN